MENKLFSIIIPHKNIPELLQRCLSSIPYRDDVEIIIIDDNSDSSFVDFENFPGIDRKDVNIIFLQEGKGAGYARNIGIKKAKGKWLLFADSDDFFTDYLSDALDSYANSLKDVIFFKTKSVYSDTLLPATRSVGVNESIDLYVQSRISFVELGLRYCTPWGKIVRKDIVDKNNLLYSETKASNDVLFGTKLILSVSDIGVDMNELYCITFRNNSLTTTPSLELLYDRLSERLKRNDLLIHAGYREYIGSVAYLLYCIYKSAGFKELFRAIQMVRMSNTPLMTGYKKWISSVKKKKKYNMSMANN